MKFIFIGMGGTNSLAIRPFLMFLNSTEIPNKEVLIIDGDSYESKNLERQDFNPLFINKNKAETKAKEFKSLFPGIIVKAVPKYIDEDSVDYHIVAGDVVFLAVDCLKTRKLVDDFAQTLSNILIVSMGNEMTDGDVQVFCKVNGEVLTPSIQDGHPEISKATVKSRSKMSCEEIAALPSGGQLIFANLQAATAGISIAWGILMATDFLMTPTIPLTRGVYFDIQLMKMRPVTNSIKELPDFKAVEV